MATGTYLTFLDSDDWWDIRYAEMMLNAMSGVDIAICDCMYLDGDEEGRIEQKVSKIRLPENIEVEVEQCPDVINRGRTFLWGKVYRKEMFDKYNIEQPSMAINDFPIVTPLLALATKVKRVGEPLYYYLRTRPGNTVTSFNALFSIEEALQVLKANFDKYSIGNEFTKPLYKMYYSQVRFALIKGLAAVKSGKGNKEEFEILKAKLMSFLDKEWKTHPIIEGKRFARPENDALENGLKLVLYDEGQMSDGYNDTADYYIVESEMDCRNKGKEIKISLDYKLKGEDLYWDIADKILFALEH